MQSLFWGEEIHKEFSESTEFHTVVESFMLEKLSEIIVTNHPAALPRPPLPNVPKSHTHVDFEPLQGWWTPALPQAVPKLLPTSFRHNESRAEDGQGQFGHHLSMGMEEMGICPWDGDFGSSLSGNRSCAFLHLNVLLP